MSDPVCVVTGAGGALGPIVAREFSAAGFHVRALSRRPLQSGLVPATTELVECDILDLKGLKKVLTGTSCRVDRRCRDTSRRNSAVFNSEASVVRRK